MTRNHASRHLLICNSSLNPVNQYLSDSIYRAALRHPEIRRVSLCGQSGIGKMVADGGYDNLLVVDGQEANSYPIMLALKHIARSAIWFFEDPYQLKENIRIADKFDVVFTNDEGSRKEYGSDAIHLPLAAEPESCYFPVHSRWTNDINFVGTAWPNRCEILFSLYDRFPKLKWHVRLLSNPSIEPILMERGWINKARKLGWHISRDSIPIRDMAALSNRSKVTLSIPRSFSLDQDKSRQASNSLPPRVFETALAGSCQIISGVSEASLRKVFPHGSLATYETLDNLCGSIDRLMGDDALCIRMAGEAQDYCLRSHTYTNRLNSILPALNRTESVCNPILQRLETEHTTLIIAHNRVGQIPFGGVEVFAERLQQSLEGQCYLAAPVRSGSHAEYVITDKTGKAVARLATPLRPVETYEDAEIERWLEQFVIDYDISAVYFAHLIHWPMSLVPRMAALGIPTILKLNDYFYICPSLNLLSFANVYCKRDVFGNRFCDDCLRSKFNLPIGSTGRRLKSMNYLLSSATHVIAPSESTKRIYGEVFPDLKHKIAVKSYPILTNRKDNFSAARPRSGGLKVLIAGSFSRHKGGDELIEVMQCSNPNIHFDVCGTMASEYSDPIRKLVDMGSVTLHGAYQPNDLPSLFGECDVALFLSIWPETYLITMTEAMICGCIPVIFDIGAPAERIVPGENGFAFPVGDWLGVLHLLEKLGSDRDRLDRIKENCLNTSYVRPNDYAGFIQELLPLPQAVRKRTLFSSMVVGNRELGIEFGSTAPPSPSNPPFSYLALMKRTLRERGLGFALKRSAFHGRRIAISLIRDRTAK